MREILRQPVALVLLAVAVSVVAAAVLGLRYREASALFALVAAVSAWVAVNRVRSRALALGLLAGLAVYASFPAKKLYGVFATYGTFGELALTLAFAAVLFLVGGGWRRNWRQGPL